MILESSEKDKLYEALSQAQSEYPTIRTNRKAFKNEYADLYAILKPVYPVLKKHGLSIRPWGGVIEGKQHIGARLMHKSGQYETNVFLFESDPGKNPNDQPSHKKQGALTYFNRNHVKDMLGILISDDPEDDDEQGHLEVSPKTVQQLFENEEVSPKTVEQLFENEIELISKEQHEEIQRVLQGQTEIAEKVKAGFGIKALKQIPKDQYSKTIDRVRFLKDQYESMKK